MRWRGRLRASVFAVCVVFMPGAVAPAAGDEHKDGPPAWDYGRDLGPEHWAEIDPTFATCGTGQRQSPIDISGEVSSDAPPVSFAYRAGPASVVNLGHTAQVNVAPGNSLEFGGETYELVQFHFHTPSENTFKGTHHPLEIHFVHRDGAGRLAVVSVVVRAGDAGPLDLLPMPGEVGGTVALDAPLNPADLLPDDTGYLTFEGSLTTPPCSEGVQWIVMRSHAVAGEVAIAHIAALIGPNNRPTHPLNGRLLQAGE